MTGLLLAMLLAMLIAAAMLWLARPGRAAALLLGTALLLGLTGYAWQGRPGLVGSPTPPGTHPRGGDTLFAHERSAWLETVGPEAQQLDGADAFIRNGDPDYAVGLLRAYLRQQPRSMMLWLGLANALQAHGDGMLTPPARFAFDQAARVAPGHPAPPYFLGLAELQMGDAAAAWSTWSTLLASAPANAPWRQRLIARMTMLQKFVALREQEKRSAVPKRVP